MPSISLSYQDDDDVEKNDAIVESLMAGRRSVPLLVVNGQVVPEHKARQARPSQTLLSFLRDVLHLSGTKLGCAEGGCGACTVMISRSAAAGGVNDMDKKYAVNACLMPVLAADGCHITTVEGVGMTTTQLHPLQKAMVEMHGSQCGFCTPGIIVAMYALFANGTTTSVQHVEEHMDGNLCRCTGYRPIWDAARSLCDEKEINNGGGDGPAGPCGTPCRECPQQEECTMECNTLREKNSEVDIVSTCLSDKVKQFQTQHGMALPDPPVAVEQLLDTAVTSQPLMVRDASFTWFQPTSVQQMLALMNQFAETKDGYKIVVGNTEVGIETKFKHFVYPRLIYPSPSIEELYGIRQTDTHLTIGACTSLSDIQHYCHELSLTKTTTPAISRIATPIYNMLRWFASTQIRNVACLGGNLVTASPISDMNPLLASMGAVLVLASTVGGTETGGEMQQRRMPVSDFFTGYRKVQLQPGELVQSVEIPLPQPVLEYVVPFKQARRREDDISIVTAGMKIRLGVGGAERNAFDIQDVSLAFGGMAPTTILAKKTAQMLVGQTFGAETFGKARQVIQSELLLPVDVPGGQAQYRCTLVSSFLHQFYLHVCQALQADVAAIQADEASAFSKWVRRPLPPVPVVSEEEQSGTVSFLHAKKPSIRGVQKYPAPKVVRGLEHELYGVASASASSSKPQDAETQAGKAAAAAAGDDGDKVTVGKAVPHASGVLHCTGEATYTDDIPLPCNTLQASLVMASKCNAKLVSIDIEEALQIPGVVSVYCHTDLMELGGDNAMGPIVLDEVVFLPIGERVSFHGQVLGICVAETLEQAELGARAVKVEYEECKEKTIVTIQDAIEAGSFYDSSRHTLERGNVREALAAQSDGSKKHVVVSGSFRCGGQDHFYLETNSSLVVPSEGATNLTVYCSTQAINKTQNFCASATNTPASKVVVRVKRMGGGFGGKETRSVFASCAAAVAAKRSNRPVRLTLSRDVDMQITGGRHAFLFHYKASATVADGGVELEAFDVQLYSNGGAGMDLSGPIVDRALFHIDGVYYWPHFRAVGVACKTVQPPHTAFRGFGAPQGMAACEHVLEHLSTATGVPAQEIRRSNIYSVGQSTPFGMVIGETDAGKWNVPTMWDRLCRELDVPQRQATIDAFNAKHKWLKRGLSVLPTKFGIAFTAKYMNQGGALVHLYTDGTVLVTHGGTEMGQGLHTKVCQMAAQAFDVELDQVYVNDSSTDKVANSMPTAASQSTDLYGMATLDACQQILRRLAPYREKLGKEAPLKAVAKAAHMDRVDLSAHGFYTLDTKRCGYNWDGTAPPKEHDSSDQPENAWRGHPFNYFTQGVAVTEVEVEVLTGNHRTLSSDILVDVGSSINPSIDIGQIEGAFIQGMGWSTMEEVIYADDDHTWIRPTGRSFTTGPGTYKIPSFNDAPERFHVSLLEKVDNPFAVHSSKAIGEPPFFLGCSVFYAIRNAVAAARGSPDDYFELRMPGTSERIRMACGDEISQTVVEQMATEEGAFQPKGSF